MRNLWAALRKNNFDIHILESKTHDAEEKIEELTSRVEQVSFPKSDYFQCCSTYMKF